MDDIRRENLVFAARNRHHEPCGRPPGIETASEAYCGYYENEWGEQFVFVFDRPTGKALLYGGDIGWGSPVEVTDPQRTPVSLNENERLWLTACWRAATRQ